MTATHKRTHASALADAEALRALFPPSTYERWEFGGSIRRGKPEVSDVEHIIIPKCGEVQIQTGLFAEWDERNLLWFHLDALMKGRPDITKHVYRYGDTGAPIFCWGEKHRGIDFRGFNHEFFTAEDRNWGCQLLIRTGSEDFSREFVTKLKVDGRYKQSNGYLWEPDDSALGWRIIPVPDEQTYFRLNGMKYIEPRDRV